MSSSSSTLMNNPREQRRQPMMNAVPLRGDSHSPAPDGIGGGGGGRQQRQLEYAHNMTMSNQSSDEEGYDDIPMGAGHLPAAAAATSTAVSSNNNYNSMNIRPNPIRRVRHAEVVLVDQTLVAYGRTWLRLRWPGDQGGLVDSWHYLVLRT